jgi:hypothetical protein
MRRALFLVAARADAYRLHGGKRQTRRITYYTETPAYAWSVDTAAYAWNTSGVAGCCSKTASAVP